MDTKQTVIRLTNEFFPFGESMQYTYCYDYLRSKVLKFTGKSRSEVARLTQYDISDSDMYAIAFLYLLKSYPSHDLIMSLSAEDLDQCKQIINEANKLIDGLGDSNVKR